MDENVPNSENPEAIVEEPNRAPEADLAGEEREATDELETLRNERDLYHAQLLRAFADLQNVRRRALQEKQSLEKYATENLIRELLPILDNFDRTLAAIQSGADAEAIANGIQMVSRQLASVLEGKKVTRIPTVGHPFDPEHHEALGTEATTEFEPDTVTVELEAGYLMADRVLKPARVRVAKAP